MGTTQIGEVARSPHRPVFSCAIGAVAPLASAGGLASGLVLEIWHSELVVGSESRWVAGLSLIVFVSLVLSYRRALAVPTLND